MLTVNILTASRRATCLAGFAPIHGRRGAAAHALEAGGLGGEVLAIMTQRAHGVNGRHVAPPPSRTQRGPQHARTRHDAPVVGRLGPDRHGGARQSHRAHPETKNEDGVHGVSLGFTSHYALMRERFGECITLGCAGENIIVETTGRIAVEDLDVSVALLAPDGRELVRLDVLQVAHPCRPFTGWALGGTVEADVLKEQLQFLDGGTRGYYCRGVGSGIVALGNLVVLL